METLLHTGELPEGKEKTSDFEIFVELIVATRIRRFTDRCKSANEIAGKWAQILTTAFCSGTYSQSDYETNYLQVFGRKPKGGRLTDFVSFYQISLLSGMLDRQTESLMLDYILKHESGIYYVYESRLDVSPAKFQSKEVSRYLAAIELLARYESGKHKLSFAYDWLKANQQWQAHGTWTRSKGRSVLSVVRPMGQYNKDYRQYASNQKIALCTLLLMSRLCEMRTYIVTLNNYICRLLQAPVGIPGKGGA